MLGFGRGADGGAAVGCWGCLADGGAAVGCWADGCAGCVWRVCFTWNTMFIVGWRATSSSIF